MRTNWKMWLPTAAGALAIVCLIAVSLISQDLPENADSDKAVREEVSERVAELPAGIAAFRQWQERVRTIPNERMSPAVVSQGVEAAQARREEMKVLIANDPAKAISLRLTRREREALPQEVRAHLEREVMGKGFYGVLVVCGHGNESSHDEVTREVMLDGTLYTAHVYGKGHDRLTEDNTSIYGVAVGKQLALHEDPQPFFPRESLAAGDPCGELGAVLNKGVLVPVDSQEDIAALAAPEAKSAEPAAGALGSTGNVFDPANPPSSDTPPTAIYDKYTGTGSWQLGPKTCMVILVTVSGGEPWTNPKSFATLSGELDEGSQWYYDSSYRQTWFGPKRVNVGESDEMDIDRLVVTPVLALSGTQADYKASFALLRNDSIAAARAQGGEWDDGPKDPYNFDRVVVMSNTKLINATGLAYVGGTFAWTNGSLKGSVAMHEWGHNWGVFHANFWTSNDQFPRSADGSHSEYGDKADVMGNGGTDDPFSPLFLERLKFLSVADGDIVEVATSGTYRLFDHQDEHSDKAATRVRGLKLAITNYTSKYIMLGLRHRNGTDGGTSRDDWNRNAIEIHADGTSPDSGKNNGSHLLDSTLGSEGGRNDAALLIGHTYSEAADLNGDNINGELHVTPITRGNIEDGGHTHEYMDVVINLGNYTGNQAPTATLELSDPYPGPGEEITITANASDPDGDPLAFAWTFGDGKYGLVSQAVVQHSWSSVGQYEVKAIVTDMKGKTYEATATVNVGGAPPGGLIEFAAATAGVDEDAGTITLNVSRTGNFEGAVSLDFASSNDTATAGTDYAANSGALSWADGESAGKTIVIDITDDGEVEADETFKVTLSNLSGATFGGTTEAIVTIVDDEDPGEVGLAVANVSVDENAETVSINVTRTGGSDGPASVDYTTADGTATAGNDYTAQTATLTWAAGNSDTQAITVNITDDAATEDAETFVISLSNPSTGLTLGTSTATVTININDQYGVITLPVVEADVNEDAGTINVTVSRIDGSEGEVGVYYETVHNTASAGSDFTHVSGTLTWSDGDDADKTIEIAITDDTDAENNEDFTVELASPTGGATIGNDTQTLTILANDAPGGVIALASATASVDEDAGSITLTVSRSDGSVGVVSVDYATSNDSATAGDDYSAATGTITWNDGETAGKSISIDILDDSTYEGDEAFTVTLSNLSGSAVLGTAETEVTIVEDESPTGRIEVAGNGDFGATYVDDGTVVRTFTISNTGTSALTIQNVSIGGSNAAAFSITANPADTVAAGASTTCNLTFDPSSEGSKVATLSIRSDDPSNGTVVVDLVGEALAGSTPALPPPSSDDDDGCSITPGLGSVSWLPILLVLIGIRFCKRKTQQAGF